MGWCQFKDNIWDGMVSTGKYDVTEHGRVTFQFEDSYIKVNNPMKRDGAVRVFYLFGIYICWSPCLIHPTDWVNFAPTCM